MSQLGRQAVNKTHVDAMVFHEVCERKWHFWASSKNTDWTNLVKFKDLPWTVRPQLAFLGKLEKNTDWTNLLEFWWVVNSKCCFRKTGKKRSASRKQPSCTFPVKFNNNETENAKSPGKRPKANFIRLHHGCAFSLSPSDDDALLEILNPTSLSTWP